MPFGPYAEQLWGTAFSAPRATNKRSWFYRIQPSAVNGRNFRRAEAGYLRTAPCRDEGDLAIGQLRWRPIEIPAEPCSSTASMTRSRGGFVPGAMSLHNGLLPDGPDADACTKASTKTLVPERLSNETAFMFETRYALNATAFAVSPGLGDEDYRDCWSALEANFVKPV